MKLLCILVYVVVISVSLGQERTEEDKVMSDGTCLYHGEQANNGQCFDDPLSCNRCCCENYGVRCTKKFCPKQPSDEKEDVKRKTEEDTTCEYEGKIYKVLENFMASDNCNTCQCTEEGLITCSEMACLEGHPDADFKENPYPIYDNYVCEFRGKRYGIMDNFDAEDGCNVCTCNGDGTVSCTQRQCMDIDDQGPGYEEYEFDDPDTADVKQKELCTYAGKTYSTGESFDANDGCNKCSCGKNGAVACTMMFCVGKNTDGVGMCNYNDNTYSLGDSFPSTDGCNTCNCDASGAVSCTEMACLQPVPDAVDNAGDPSSQTSGHGHCHFAGRRYDDGATFTASDGCNTCSCNKHNVACTYEACVDSGCESVGGGFQLIALTMLFFLRKWLL